MESQMRQIEKDKEHNDPNEEVEYTQMSRDIQALRAELEQINEKKKVIQLVSDQVGGWTNRVATKMNQQLQETGELNI